MATINQLLNQPGPFITALLPDFQELVAIGNKYLNNQIAAMLFEKMRHWGGAEVRPEDLFFALDNKGPSLKEFGNGGSQKIKGSPIILQNAEFKAYEFNSLQTSLANNFLQKLNSFDMAASNAWLDFMKAYQLFHKMVEASVLDGIKCYTVDPATGVKTEVPCSTILKKIGYDFYNEQFGGHERPLLDGEGIGSDNIYTADRGGAGTHGKTIVDYSFVDSRCCPDNCECWEDRYFVLYDGLVNKKVVWFNAGTGTEPVVAGGGTVNYIEVDISLAQSSADVKAAADTAISVEGTYGAVNDRCCPPFDCGCLTSSAYEAVAVGATTDAEDGVGGISYPDTNMYASDGYLLASGVVTDQQWVDTHNNVRRAYELDELGIDTMYFTLIEADEKILANGSPCCTTWIPEIAYAKPVPCSGPCSKIVQTTWEGDIFKLPVNKPGVLADNRGGRSRTIFK